MAIQILRALSGATTIVALDTSDEKLKIAKSMGADEVLLSGDAVVKRIKDITKGQGAELVLDMVGVAPTLKMSAEVARVLGHLTIVGLGSAAVPVNFRGLALECLVAAPYGGYMPLASAATVRTSGRERPDGIVRLASAEARSTCRSEPPPSANKGASP